MEFNLDTYNFRARLAPFLLVILPAAMAVSLWLPTESDAWKSLGGLGVGAALTFLMVQLGRDLGKAKQVKLFAAWDGKPTTRMLRHRDRTLDPHSKARYHTKLGLLLPDAKIPSPRSETGNPRLADDVYESCVRHLLEATRDKRKYPLISESNIAYGFRRNFWGMKPAGITCSILGLLSSSTNIVYHLLEASSVPMASVIAVVISGLLFTWWIFRVTPHWVKLAGDAYAERLLAACETLGGHDSERP